MEISNFSEAVRELMAMPDDLVPAKCLAPVLGMHESVIVAMAKDGTWPREVCNYIVSGSHAKFYRHDFLKKGGWVS